MDAKQQKIKEAWVELVGEANFPKLKLDELGFSDWRCREFCIGKWDELYSKLKQSSKKLKSGIDLIYRPKSLQGIENNNGWTKIESEADLPKGEGLFWASNENHIYDFTYTAKEIELDYKVNPDYFTHYQPIEKPNPPIY